MFYSLLVGLIVTSVQALEVSSGSSCADVCEGPTNTFPTDLSCVDSDYTSTDRGSLMEACIECESQSTYVDTSKAAPQDNDQYWMLFNMKYTLQYCLTQQGTDKTPNFAECDPTCKGLYPALSASWFTTPRPATYDYCTIKDDAFTSYVDNCASCLLSRSGSVVLGNFLAQLKSGCDTQASAHNGTTIPIQRQLFDTSTVAYASTSASSSASSSATSAASSTTPTGASSTIATGSSSSATSSSEAGAAPVTANKSSGLSSGAAAGIGVGCGLGALVLGIAAFWYYRRRRNTVRVPRSAVDQPPHYDSQLPPSQSYENKPLPVPSPLPTPSRAESYGHERYEMGGQGQRAELDTPVKSEGTYASELDSRPVARQDQTYKLDAFSPR